MNAYLFLFLAIGLEIIATSSLKASNGFTRFAPSVLVVLGYGGAFYLMTLALRSLSLGFVYATWAGLGTVGVAVVGVLLYDDPMNVWKVAGIALVIAGVVILNAAGGGTR